MKIRNGFVSNSSSSSFILIVKEEDHLKALDNLDSEFEKKFLNNVMSDEKKFGTKFKFYFGHNEDSRRSIHYVSANDDDSDIRDNNLFVNLREPKENAWNNYVAMLDKLGVDYFYFSNYT